MRSTTETNEIGLANLQNPVRANSSARNLFSLNGHLPFSPLTQDALDYSRIHLQHLGDLILNTDVTLRRKRTLGKCAKLVRTKLHVLCNTWTMPKQLNGNIVSTVSFAASPSMMPSTYASLMSLHSPSIAQRRIRGT